MKYYQNRYNLYRRIDSVTDMEKELDDYKEKNLIYTNEQISLKEMFIINDNYIKENGYNYKQSSNKKYKHRYGISLEILLPHDLDCSYYFDLSKSIIEYVTKKKDIKLPYYSYLIEKGEGTYLRCIIFEREYHDEPIILEKKTSKDIYINSKTKRYCKPNNPDAVLLKKAGSVLSVKQTNLSNKVTWFYFSNKDKNPFDKFQKNLDGFLISQFITYGVPIMNSFFTQRINMKKYPLNYREGLKRLNKFLKYIDKRINELEDNTLVDAEQDFITSTDYIELCQYVHFYIYPQIKKLCEIETNSEREFSLIVGNYINLAIPSFKQKIDDIEMSLFESFL